MTREEKQIYWLWLGNIPTVGRRSIGNLLEYFETPVNIYNASEKELAFVISKEKAHCVAANRDLFSMEGKLKDIARRKIRFVTPEDGDYPSKLRHLEDYPIGIYVKGKLPDENRITISIVGARNATYYGKEMARLFARELAKKDVQIVSGLAFGVDASAHIGAMEGDGYTLGVLGCGINICYPKENYRISHEMEQTGGIISEYGLYEKPLPGYFPMRNRIISALSDGILVAEAKRKSGSLITVDQGLELGRSIYALPGKITDGLSEGCNHLIQQGAKLVTSPGDILEDFCEKVEKEKIIPQKEMDGLVTNEKKVYSCLSLEPKYIDYIIEETGFRIQETLSLLYDLESRGIIKQTVKNYYSICV